MKTRTNLKSSSRRHLASLALLLATVSLIAVAPSAARASTETPFHANFITQFKTFLEFPILHVTVNSRGQATHMGRTSAFTDDQIVNLLDGSGSATYTLTAANGDTLILALVVQPGGTINVEGGVIFSGDLPPRSRFKQASSKNIQNFLPLSRAHLTQLGNGARLWPAASRMRVSRAASGVVDCLLFVATESVSGKGSCKKMLSAKDARRVLAAHIRDDQDVEKQHRAERHKTAFAAKALAELY